MVNDWKGDRTGYAFIKQFGGQAVPGMPACKLLSLEKYEELVEALPGPETTAPLLRHRRLTDDQARQLALKRFLLLENYDKKKFRIYGRRPWYYRLPESPGRRASQKPLSETERTTKNSSPFGES